MALTKAFQLSCWAVRHESSCWGSTWRSAGSRFETGPWTLGSGYKIVNMIAIIFVALVVGCRYERLSLATWFCAALRAQTGCGV